MITRHGRIAIFVMVCMVLRILLVYTAYAIDKHYLPYMGYGAAIIAVGFATIYVFKLQRAGNVGGFGGQVWWDHLRPIHAMLYLVFAMLAIAQHESAYVPLLIDISVGVLSFFHHYYT